MSTEPSGRPHSELPAGLTAAEAAARLERDGPNALPSPPPPAAWRLLAEQFLHFFAVLLWIAAGLAFVSGTAPLGVAIVLVVVLGAVLWIVILSRSWFVVYEPGAVRRGLPFVVVLPTLLAAGMIVVDLLVVLPPDFNVRFPDSLFFYPAIGFVVEVVFHLLPLAALLLATSTRVEDVDRLGVP